MWILSSHIKIGFNLQEGTFMGFIQVPFTERAKSVEMYLCLALIFGRSVEHFHQFYL